MNEAKEKKFSKWYDYYIISFGGQKC